MKSGFNNKGFSLVELLVVCGMVGLVMAAVFMLYQTHQRTAYTQEEVVEVQQNLRIAMDSITKDIKMAGFLTPLPQTVTSPLTASDADSITINTASESGASARIIAIGGITTAGAATTFTVNSSSGFGNGNVVRIMRPVDNSQPSNQTFTVTGTSATTITLNIPAGISYNNGDIIVRTTTNANNPSTIQYFLTNGNPCPSGQWCIARTTNGGTADVDTQIIANNICANPANTTCIFGGVAAPGLQFSYLTDAGTESAAVADYNVLRAVRVTITGQTVTTMALSGGEAKQRQLASVVRVRNRRLEE